ncbi:threonine aldolase family protein [Fodinicola feengrottensis]|uniref:Low specificity L-threonine aldolase n=1 Tax=Fodinicola feengrottensis TaxID=435914 RepID=A0ABN2IFA4_9ACTN|nr:GntG family PLP-dependent aldolase [Fodinicola feengrottensis]
MTVDLRSDTVTKPSQAMRAAMAAADVGDDVYGEDPEINALEAEAAALFGHEAALFVPTGTMGNQIGVALHAAPGDEVLCDIGAHLLAYERGGSAAFFGITSRTIVTADGICDPAAYEAQVREGDWHTVGTRVLQVENTHNRGGGRVQPLAALRGLRRVADDAGIAVHCDGARIWNAHVASGVPLHAYGQLFDTVSVCLSKGLGAPVGSLLISTADRMGRARVLRGRMGGAMRQAGVLAAAGRYALKNNLERLAQDHARARRLADALVPYGLVDPAQVQTNLVMINLPAPRPDAATVARAAAEAGVLVSAMDERRVRLVTHLDVSDDDVDVAIKVLTGILT